MIHGFTIIVSPEQALQMADFVNARYVIPVHWGTFIQSDEPTHEPIERFKKAINTNTIRLALDSHGQTWSLPVDHA